MELLIRGLAPIALIGLIMGAVITRDVWRKRRRSSDKTSLGVVYIWEARLTIKSGWKELAKGDPAARARAFGHFTEAWVWLNSERKYGSKRRRLIIARLMENAELGQEQARPQPAAA